MKKGIIFDMDGTLWDSAESVAEAWRDVIRVSGMLKREITATDIKGVMGKTMDVAADILFSELSQKERMDLLDQCCGLENEYLREHGGILYEGVRETFQKLREQGYHVSIVSNCQAGYIEAFLDHYKLWDAIDDKQCYGDNLLQKGENIRIMVERNKLEQAVYVGDIQGDYEASCEAGVAFIYAAYGFGTIDAKVPAIHSLWELTGMDIDAVSARK